MASPERLYISPNPSDSGQALGFALLGAYELAGWEPPDTELTEYLGPPYTDEEIKKAAELTQYQAVKPEDPVDLLIKCIVNGYITARLTIVVKGSYNARQNPTGNRQIGHRQAL
jgi:predicted NodU family carbamoyl transferase